jgi:Ca2+-dependent lipid-binding protein
MLKRFYGALGRAIVIGFVYFMGRYDFSFGWLMPLLFSTFHRNLLQPSRRERNLSPRRTAVASLQEVPAWTMFPDVERVEWVNSILSHFWLKIDHVVAKVLKTKLQPKLQKIPLLRSFEFKALNLGSNVIWQRAFQVPPSQLQISDASSDWNQSLQR